MEANKKIEPFMELLDKKIHEAKDMLIERYKGDFPLWLSPEQVRILPVTDRAIDYSKTVLAKLEQRGIRATIDSRNEGIGYKIRQAQLEKIPYFFIVGDKECENGTLSLRSRKEGDLGVMTPDEFLAKILVEIATKSL